MTNTLFLMICFLAPLVVWRGMVVQNSNHCGFKFFHISTIVGTFVHEFSHALMAFLTMAAPMRMSIVPRKEQQGHCLGEVSTNCMTWLNAPFICLAPLLGFLLAGYLTTLTSDSTLEVILLAWVAATIALHALPSKADLFALKKTFRA